MKKNICAVLSVLLAFSMCGCRKISDESSGINSPGLSETEISDTDSTGGKISESTDISVTKTGIYISEEYKLPENLDFRYGLAAVNDKIVVTGSEKVSPDYSIYLYDEKSGKTRSYSPGGEKIRHIYQGTVSNDCAYLCLQNENSALQLLKTDFNNDLTSASEILQNYSFAAPYIMETENNGDIGLIYSGSADGRTGLYKDTYDKNTLELKNTDLITDEIPADENILSVIRDSENGYFVLTEQERMDYCLMRVSSGGQTVFSEYDSPDDIGGIYAGMYKTEDNNPVMIAVDEEDNAIYHADVFDKDTGTTIDRFDFSLSGENIYLADETENEGAGFSFTRSGILFTMDPDTQTCLQKLNLRELIKTENAHCEVLSDSDSGMLFFSSVDQKYMKSSNSNIWITDAAGKVLSELKSDNAFSPDYAMSDHCVYGVEKLNNELIITKTDTETMSLSEIKTDLSEIENFSPKHIEVNSDGSIIVSSPENILFLNSNGEIIDNIIQGSVDSEEYISDISATGSGYALLKQSPEGTKILYADDISSKPAELDCEIKSISSFANTIDKSNLYMVTSEGILKYSVADTKISYIMKWADSEISEVTSDSDVFLTDCGNLVWTSFDKTFVYREADEETAGKMKDKEIITIACDETKDFINRAVAEFNRTNSGFRIEINDYSKFNQNYTDSASFDKLNLDIASGKIPDIVIGGNSIDTVHFSRMGMFADLNKYFEKDSELNKDDFFTGITDLFSADGKLYRLPLSIYLNAAICREGLPGKENSWTFDEFFSADNLFYLTSREDMVRYLITENLEEYIDFSGMACHFDDIYFSKLLTYIKENTESEEEITETLSSETAYSEYRSRFSEGLCNAELCNIEYADKLTEYSELSSFTLRGMPSVSENIYPAVSSDNFICISEHSEHKDEVWKFIKLIMSEKYQDTIGENQKHIFRFSIRKDSFDKMISECSEEITADAAGKLKKAVESSNRAALSDSHITGIINEQTSLFFSDAQTIYETVNNIQNQVRTYLMEIK